MLAARRGGHRRASVGTAAAVIADCTPPEKRAKGMALIGTRSVMGFTLGPLIAYFGPALFDGAVGRRGAGERVSFVASWSRVATSGDAQPDNKAGKILQPRQRPRCCAFRPSARSSYLLPGDLRVRQLRGTLDCSPSRRSACREDNFLVFATVGAVLMFAGGNDRPLVKKLPEQKMLAVRRRADRPRPGQAWPRLRRAADTPARHAAKGAEGGMQNAAGQ